MDKNDLEALKLLSDWCKWSVVAQGGVIAAIGAFAKPEDIAKLSHASRICLGATVVFFLISIIPAAILLKSLPATAQYLPPPQGKDIYHMGTFEGTKGLRIYTVAGIQTIGFVLGVLAFGAFVISRILG